MGRSDFWSVHTIECYLFGLIGKGPQVLVLFWEYLEVKEKWMYTRDIELVYLRQQGGNLSFRRNREVEKKHPALAS